MDHNQISFPRASLAADCLCDNRSGLSGFDGFRQAHAILEHVSRYLRDPPNLERPCLVGLNSPTRLVTLQSLAVLHVNFDSLLAALQQWRY